MGTGVLSRAAIISAVYQQALQFTQKSRGQIPNGKLVNHISTDTSRIDFAAGFSHMLWTAPVQMIVIISRFIIAVSCFSRLTPISHLDRTDWVFCSSRHCLLVGHDPSSSTIYEDSFHVP